MFGIVGRLKGLQQRARSLAELNLELAKLEGKQKATVLGIGGALGAGAAVLVVYAIGFLFAALAAGINEALPLWLSLLITALLLLLVAAVLGFLAVRFFKKASPPKPAQAIEEAGRTLETLKSHV